MKKIGFLLFVWIHVIHIRTAITLKYSNCECGLANNGGNRIVGGWASTPHQFPWLVPIFNKNKLYCGGAIINDRYILTAGHCVRWTKTSDVTIQISAHDIKFKSSNDIYKAQQFILHPEFLSHELYDENDIALIKLDKPIMFNRKVRPVCLPTEDSEYSGEYATVAGWGKTGTNRKLSTLLQETIVKVLSHEDCAKTTMKSVLTPTVMCAYMNSADSCQGDSGGPLVYETEPGKMVQIGVVSWGIGCGSESPGIYTKISEYLDWIYYSSQDGVFCKT